MGMCSDHANGCADFVIYHNEKDDIWGIKIPDGGASFYVILFCPWCGTRLK